MDNGSKSRTYALVTGASSGIGRELAGVFAREGHALILVARRTEPMQVLAAQLQSAHGTPCVVVGADLGTPEGVAAVVREVESRGIELEVLVNNAGFGLSGPFATLPAESQLGMIDLNIRALTALTRAFVPGMVARGRGYVLNVASTAAFQPGPLMAIYYATKAYVLSFSEALHEELREQGVRVTALCPGYTETEFATRAAGQHKPRLFQGFMGLGDARQVAEEGYRALKRGRARVIPGWRHRLGAWGATFSPRALVVRVTRYINTSG